MKSTLRERIEHVALVGSLGMMFPSAIALSLAVCGPQFETLALYGCIGFFGGMIGCVAVMCFD